jgi:hypothetical protein
MNPRHSWALRRELGAYARWSVGQRFASRYSPIPQNAKSRFAHHISFATGRFGRYAAEISSTMRKHQLKLADRQCRMAELSQRVQDTVVLLVTAMKGATSHDEHVALGANILCQDLERKLSGQRPSDSYFSDCARLADLVIGGEFDAAAGAPQGDILMRY